MSSGPTADDDLALLMAAMVSASEKEANAGSSFFFLIFLRTLRVRRKCPWFPMQVNCLLKRLAMDDLFV